MNSRNFNVSNEIEPRILPRQSSAVTTATVPAVPEVSHIFDPVLQNPMPSKSSPIPNTYAQWKQQVPQRLNIPDAGIRNSPRALKNSSPVDSPRKLVHQPSNHHSPANSRVKNPQNLSPNSYARDSRLKFYQKVSPTAETRVISPRNQKRGAIQSAEHYQGTIYGEELLRRTIPTSELQKTTILASENYRNAIPASDNYRNAIPTSENYRNAIPVSDNSKNASPASENYRNAIPVSENYRNAIPTSENYRNAIPASGNYRNAIPTTDNYKNTTSAPDSYKTASIPASEVPRRAIPPSNPQKPSTPPSNPPKTPIPPSQFHKQSTPPPSIPPNPPKSTPNAPSDAKPRHPQLQRSHSLDLSRYPASTSSSTSDLVPRDHFHQNHDPSTAVERVKSTCDCHSHKSNNDEIITQLLCLIQSQNSQIQMLQGQVETLLQLRPRDLQDYQRIPIASQEYQTNTVDQRLQYSKSSEQEEKQQERLREEKIQQLIKEKKVSIGVMTSFELTVQDSVVYNVENTQKPPEIQEKVNANRNVGGRTPNKITQGLEQIVEASESHLSSTLQASNNFNTYSSARRSLQGNLGADSSIPGQLAVNNQEKRQMPDNYQELPLDLHRAVRNDPKGTSPRSDGVPEGNSPKITEDAEKRDKIVKNCEKEVENEENRVMIPNSAGEVVESQKRTPKLGWTLYDNVMCQVNEILHNSNEEETPERQKIAANQQTSQFQLENHSKLLLSGVQQSTMEQLKFFGFTFADTTSCEETRAPVDVRVPIDASYYPRLDYQANVIQTSGSASDTSIHMKALAMKYLGTNQLPNVSTHKRGMELLTSVMLSNMQNNLSVASVNDAPKIDANPQKSPRVLADCQRDNYIINGRQNPQNILDISSLKRQPKLL